MISSLEVRRLLEIQIPMDSVDVDSITKGEYACKNIYDKNDDLESNNIQVLSREIGASKNDEELMRMVE